MRDAPPSFALSAPAHRALALALCTISVLLALALAPRTQASTRPAEALAATTTPTTTTPVKPVISATLEQCLTSEEQAERSATFAGEMAALPGTTKMEMRIDVLERAPQELAFHAVVAPGLGVWRTAAPGVKTYRYLKEVTNLYAPASYRAAVRYRWLNSKGKLIKAAELHTTRCVQPAPLSGGQSGGEESSATG